MQNKGFYNRLRLLMATGSVVSLIGGWALLAQADKPVMVESPGGQAVAQTGATSVAAANLFTATPSPTTAVAAATATSTTAAQRTNTATATATATPTVVKVQSTTLPSTLPQPRIRSGGS